MSCKCSKLLFDEILEDTGRAVGRVWFDVSTVIHRSEKEKKALSINHITLPKKASKKIERRS